MKKFCILFLFLFISLTGINILKSQHDKYIFTKIDGRAILSRTQGSNWLSLQGYQPIEVKPGDQLKVEGDGRGELRFPDGTVIRMKNNAAITLMRSGIQLSIGYVWLKIPRRHDIFKVFTPLGSCSVLGTSFDVNVDRFGKTKVRVFNGIVAIRAAKDLRNRQLVLQQGMQTILAHKDRVAKQPDKFSAVPAETSLSSEWESRGLPPMKPEITVSPTTLPPANEIISESEFKPYEKDKDKQINVIARQRSAFLEAMRQKELKKDSVLGNRIEEKDRMYRDGHNLELGHYHRPDRIIRNRRDLDREYANTRNRLLRVQSQIRQTELEIADIFKTPTPSSSQQKAVLRLQSELIKMREEHRALTQKLRELENFK
jgi:hypothetical protein